MKRKLIIFATALLLVCLTFCGCVADPSQTADKATLLAQYKDNISQEMRGSFDFFWNEAQTQTDSPAYGLIADRWPSDTSYASIASVGFGLTAYIIGVEEGYVSREDAEKRASGTLSTLIALQSDPTVSYGGFLAHFINKNTAKRHGKCEVSSIDTAILVCGAIAAGEYFGGEVKQKADTLYRNVDWTSFVMKKGKKTYFSMAYDIDSKKLSSGCWDWYAEQLMLYVLAAGSPEQSRRVGSAVYNDFTRRQSRYNGNSFVYSYFGSIFTYQYSHAWIDFSSWVDGKGVNWYQNSVDASLANYEYCKDKADSSKTFAHGGWGLTACDSPKGYNGLLGATPRGWTADSDYYKYEGTVAPAGALGSVVFTPSQSLAALEKYQSVRLINTKYGLTDAYNLDYDWYDSDCIGIDKGISLLMLSNFKDGLVWKYTMQNKAVTDGLTELGFTQTK